MFKKFIFLFLTITQLPKTIKVTFVILCDIILGFCSLWFSFFLRLETWVPLNIIYEPIFFITALLSIAIFWLAGLYHNLIRYSGKSTIITICLAHLAYCLILIIIFSINSIPLSVPIILYEITTLVVVPKSICVLQPLILFFLVSTSRLCVRYILDGINILKNTRQNLPVSLIYGAGSAGQQLAYSLEYSKQMKVAGFIDDDLKLQGKILLGKKIYPIKDLEFIISKKNISHLFFAIPSANRKKRSELLKKITSYKLIVKTLPSVSDLIEGKVSVSDIKELNVEDLLQRDEVLPNTELLKRNIESKVVLVTGAGGSIGSELCRQIIKHNCKKIILVEWNEYALYEIYNNLLRIKNKLKIKKELNIIPLLASIQDKERIEEIFKIFKPDTIYHAAAYKHVSLVEENICDGVKNNVLGTLNLAKAASAARVDCFVLISTDKAVRPTSIMGASKRLSELCLQAISRSNHNKKTKFCMVRFGNVLASSGSIIPKFSRQIKEGGPVTLTHPDVTRYFMTAVEAAQLVIQAGAMAREADVFVLDMGSPVKIYDLIKKMIKLSGMTVQDENNPDGDIAIKIIGLKPGEKLFEEPLLGTNPQQTQHLKIQRAQDPFITWDQLETDLKELKLLIEAKKTKEVVSLLSKLIDGFKSNEKWVDHTVILREKNS